uniref:Uncharacterized protein n=1 Tax=Plectus sambesii TaxID=2011161 RepID=A0A914W325_9BILA
MGPSTGFFLIATAVLCSSAASIFVPNTPYDDGDYSNIGDYQDGPNVPTSNEEDLIAMMKRYREPVRFGKRAPREPVRFGKRALREPVRFGKRDSREPIRFGKRSADPEHTEKVSVSAPTA